MTSKRTIYVEATPLVRENRTGVDYYAIGLFSSLVKKMPDVEFVFFYFSDVGENLSITGKNIKSIKITSMSSHAYRLKLMLGIAPNVEQLINRSNLETVLFTNFYSWPVACKDCTVVPFVYDTTFIDTPDYVTFKNRILLKQQVKRSVKSATKIVTISEAAKQALISHYGRSDRDYEVIYPAPAKSLGIKRVDGVPENYLLFVGTLEPRKNVENLINAHLNLNDQIREKYPLVLAGGKGWHDKEIVALIEQNAGNHIYHLGYVSNEEKTWLYRHAFALVYPAVFEGFGMPIVEAMAEGTPVVTCSNTSLPEAGGDAAIYCNESVEGIIEGMLACIHDKRRTERIKEGVIHAKQFSWEISAEKMKELLKGVNHS